MSHRFSVNVLGIYFLRKNIREAELNYNSYLIQYHHGFFQSLN